MKTQRKIWLYVGIACILAIAAFCLAGCGRTGATTSPEKPGGEHTHSWSQSYYIDGDRHYQTCSGCSEKLYGNHSYNAMGYCICGKEKPQTHTHHYTPQYDDTYHWQECDAAGCPEKITAKAAHDTAVGGVCSVCGYTKALLTYKTLQATDDTVYGKVSNSTQTFSFLNEVTTHGGATYTVSTDMGGTQVIPTKTVSLEIGDNTFYVLATRGDDLKLFTVTIRRRPIYTVTFDTVGGTACESRQIEEDSLTTAPDTSKMGYTFAHWDYDFAAPIVRNTNITASWTANNYTVTLDPNGGTVSDDAQSVTYDVAYTLPTPTRTGYTFTGWYGGEEKVADSAVWKFTENKSLSAHWQINSYTVRITGNTSAGTVSGADTYAYGTRVSVTASESNLGYHWVGWFDGDTKLSEEKNYTFSLPAKDVNLTATWDVNDEMRNFTFTSIADTCTITGVKDKTVTQMQIPDYVTNIGDKAFYGCTGLTSITIPDSVMRIEDSAFSGCTGLTSIIIPDSVTSIGYRAFSRCTGLTSITIPFMGASKDAERYFGYIFGANYSSSNADYVPASLKAVIITGGTSIGYRAFYGCSGLTSITLPDGVTSIGDEAFRDCRSLTSVTIPDGVTSIGSSAFYGCTGLTSIVIPDSVTSIGSGALRDCSKLTIYCEAESKPSGWDSNWNFSNRPVVWSTMQVGTTEWGIQWALRTDETVYIGKYVGGGTEVVIPNEIDGHTVTSIGDSAFSGCSSLTNITIPDSVTSIWYGAFRDCSSLTSITIPDSVTSIGGYAFLGCSKLTIYCEAESKPSGWDTSWNTSYCLIVWGYKG